MSIDIRFHQNLNLPLLGSILLHGMILIVAGITWPKNSSSVSVSQRGHRGPVEFTWLPNASEARSNPSWAKETYEAQKLDSTPVSKAQRSTSSDAATSITRSPTASSNGITENSGGANSDSNSEWSAYEADVMNLLQAHKRYPEVARRMRQQGRVKVQFEVDRLGQVLRSKLLEPCPHEALNQAAQTLIAQVQKFKPFPPDIKQGRWVFTVPIEYRL